MTYRSLAMTGGLVFVLLNVSGCDWLSLLAGPTLSGDAVQNVQIRPGDYWSFSERKTVSSDEPATVYTAEYTMTVSDETVTDLAGNTARVFSTEGTGGAEGETPESFSSIDYCSQDEQGIIYLHGEFVEDEEGGYQSLVLAEDGGKFRTKAYPLVVGSTHEWDVTYDDGYRHSGSSEVVAYEVVTTSVGTFPAFRIEAQYQSSYGDWTTTCSSTRWHVAQLADNVKGEYTCHHESPEDTSDFSGEYELTDSSLLNEAR